MKRDLGNLDFKNYFNVLYIDKGIEDIKERLKDMEDKGMKI